MQQSIFMTTPISDAGWNRIQIYNQRGQQNTAFQPGVELHFNTNTKWHLLMFFGHLGEAQQAKNINILSLKLLRQTC